VHIFLDESGTFVPAGQGGSYCVVAAYIVPEATLPAMEEAVLWFRYEAGYPMGGELKRSEAPESAYLRFLERLGQLNGIVVALATDTALNVNATEHCQAQADKFLVNEPRMATDQGKQMVRQLASDLVALSPQNYVELLCRTVLAMNVVQTSTVYYAQRNPKTLGRFSWRFDQKNLTRDRFERLFASIAPGFFQALSVAAPLMHLREGDYRHFERFNQVGDAPAWLPPRRDDLPYLDAGLIWSEDLDFVDSRRVIGVQVADLICSGLFGLLRGRMENPRRAATLLGRLMVGHGQVMEPLELMTLGGEGDGLIVDPIIAERIRRIRSAARPLLLREPA
jgi:hypothetical protein